MNRRRRSWLAFAMVAMLAIGWGWHQHSGAPKYLDTNHAAFIALFAAPPAGNSLQTRRELDELLAIQEQRTLAQFEAARADRKTHVWQFAGALGLRPDEVRNLHALGALAEQVEDDLRPYVRAAKDRFRRLRPYKVETRIEPCVDNVRADLSFPSGHATYAYVMSYLLADMVPERRPALESRAREFARQRMVCGVHFPSDIEAGENGARWLAQRFLDSRIYRADARPAREELRAALDLPAH